MKRYCRGRPPIEERELTHEEWMEHNHKIIEQLEREGKMPSFEQVQEDFKEIVGRLMKEDR